MDPLFDRSGQVYGWLDMSAGRIMDRRGRHVALIRDGKVHDYRGKHLGWWDGDHFRDRTGAVAVYERGASGLGFLAPLPALPPIPPCDRLTFRCTTTFAGSPRRWVA